MKLRIANFRSIREAELDLAPITVVYGANGAGKSSLLYALLALRNVLLNPNQSADGFFNLSFLNLGGFEAVAFDHALEKEIRLGITAMVDGATVSHDVFLGSSAGRFRLSAAGPNWAMKNLELAVSFPYPANQQKEAEVSVSGSAIKLTWNGVTAQAQLAAPDQEAMGAQLHRTLNSVPEILRGVATVPLKRGFTKPFYSPVPMTPALISEDEIATSLCNNKYLVSKVSYYLEQVLGRDFRVNAKPGTAIFSLDAMDKGTGVASELVNDGFGVNQTVHLLARCLDRESHWICIEEPEVHLHPKAVAALASAIVRMSKEESEKRFIISTHSEPFIVSLLGLVEQKRVSPDKLACYLARKEGRESRFDRQDVEETGQIRGGLGSLLETELEDIRRFMRVGQGAETP